MARYPPQDINIDWVIIVCLFVLILYAPVNNFSVMSGWVFLCLTSTTQRIKRQCSSASCEAWIHNPSISSQALYHPLLSQYWYTLVDISSYPFTQQSTNIYCHTINGWHGHNMSIFRGSNIVSPIDHSSWGSKYWLNCYKEVDLKDSRISIQNQQK